MDAEGYGYAPGEPPLQRLSNDLRVLGSAGIHRIAAAMRDQDTGLVELRRAEKLALQVIDTHGLYDQWHTFRNAFLAATEGPGALLDWKAEHGESGHLAERAVLAAGMALVARPHLDATVRRTLLRATAAALPWLDE